MIKFNYTVDVPIPKRFLPDRIGWCLLNVGVEGDTWEIRPSLGIIVAPGIACTYAFLHEEDAIMFKLAFENVT